MMQKVLFKSFLLLVFFTASVTFLSSQYESNYYYIFLLPFSFFIINIVFYKTIKKLFNHIVFYIIYLQLVIRYLLIPLLISFGEPFDAGYYSNNVDIGIFLMLTELLFVFIGFYAVKIKFAFGIKQIKIKFINVNAVIVGFIIAGAIYLLANSSYFGRINFVWNLDNFSPEVKEESESADSLVGLFFFMFRVSVTLILLGIIFKLKYVRSSIKIFLIYFLIAINATIIIGVSRLSIIYVSFPFLLILMTLVPQYKKILILCSSVGVFIIILTASLSKFSNDIQTATTESLFSTNSLNAYFSGIGNVVVGIDAYEKQITESGVYYMFNDLFQNVPRLSHYTDVTIRSNVAFNKEIYGNTFQQDQIVPVSIAALFHFGYFFSYTYSFVFLFLAFYFEKKAINSLLIGAKYVFYYLALNCSLFMMINIGSIFSNILIQLLLTLIPLYFLHFASGGKKNR